MNTQNNSRAFLLNTIAGIAMILVSTASGFIVPKLILNMYGKEITGLIASITQLMSFFMLIEAGLSKSVTVNLYAPLSSGNYKEISGILTAAKLLYNKISLIFILAVSVAAVIYPFIVKSATIEYLTILQLFLVLGISGVFEFLSIRRYSVLLNADNRIGIIQITHSIRLFLQCVLISCLIHFGLPIVIVEFSSMAVWGICPVVLYFFCRKRYEKIDYSAPPNMDVLKNRHDAMIQPITLAVQTSAPIVIATILLPIDDVGILSLYMIVVRGVDNIIGVLGSATAGLGRIYANGESKRLYRAYGQFESLCCIITTVVFSTMTANYEPFMKIYSGYTISGLALLCCIRGFAINLRLPQNNMLNAIGWFRGTKRCMIIQTIIQLVGSTLLGWRFGVLGIFIGDILSQVYRDAEILIHIPKKIGFSVWPSIKRWLISIVCFIIIFYLLPHISALFVQIEGYASWLEFSIFSLSVAGIITFSAFLMFDREVWVDIFKTKIVPIFKLGAK